MKSWYRTTFDDGTYVDKEADSADLAKAQAKNDRVRDTDPGRTMNPADLRRHPAVKVASVREFTDDERAQRAGGEKATADPDPATGRTQPT